MPPILRKHYEKVKPMGVSLVKFCQCYWPHEWAVWSGIMKERGMIFNGEMVRAILDGREDADPAAYQMETDSVH
ncbi:Uncharacterised protein [Klebsiella pneumoniae]|uniref:Uncharacterized protein n=1 Tax=Klebsiella pneumoniae TaxID=573 RepID=A0A2X3EAL0_KLEPN|nr:Uncharacterised protein [Klebsiella pneumoniae]